MTTAFQAGAFQPDAFQVDGSVSYSLSGSAGSYTVVGQSASATYTSGSTAYTLSGSACAYLITGNDATAIWSGASSGGGDYERNKVRRKVAKLNAEILEQEAKKTADTLVKAISKQAIQQVDDEEEVLMLLLA